MSSSFDEAQPMLPSPPPPLPSSPGLVPLAMASDDLPSRPGSLCSLPSSPPVHRLPRPPHFASPLLAPPSESSDFLDPLRHPSHPSLPLAHDQEEALNLSSPPDPASPSLFRPPSPLYPPRSPYSIRQVPSPPPPLPSPALSHFGVPTRPSSTTWTTDSDRTVGRDSSCPLSTQMVLLDKIADEADSEAMGFFQAPSKPTPFRPASSHSPNPTPPRPCKRSPTRLFAVVLVLLATLAIILGFVLGLKKSKSAPVAASPGSLVTASGNLAKLWGSGGDMITMENGTTFLYNNTLGGTWVAVPFNDTAKCQDNSPPLNEPWDYSKRRIFGVNLGGWLVLEPFITPYLFEKFNSDDPNSGPPTVVDEWTLSLALGKDLASTLEEHYRTFITEADFAEIASAGLNWIRIPVGWWMIETWPGEPMLAGVSFKYFQKALRWARKYGLRVNLDLHSVPGSQNGYNHSGRLGSINFLIGLMGVANAQRTLNYVRTLTQFISQPEYSNVVPMFTVLNEPIVQKIGPTQIRAYYLKVYQMMRNITGYGQGKGPMMVIHDGFNGLGAGHTGWGGFLKGADRLGLDTHTYFAFDKQTNESMAYNALKPCLYWAKSFNQTNTEFGFNFAGEYSLAINDCGLWLNNIGVGSRYDGTFPNSTAPDLKSFPVVGSCDFWKDYRAWTPEVKQHLADLAFASQDAMQNSFFWTWKISPSIHSKDGLKPNPMWDYQLGLRQGWIRPDARQSVGGCAVVAAQQGTSAPVQAWSGQFEDWQVGTKTGGSSIEPEQVNRYGQWPPTSILVQQGQEPTYTNVDNLPQYVDKGPVVVLKPEPPRKEDYPASASIGTGGTGWANDADKAGWYVPVKGCQYPDPWAAGGLPEPTSPFCGGGHAKA